MSRALLLTFARRGEDALIQRAAERLQQADPEVSVVAVGTPVSAPVLRDLGLAEIVMFSDGAPARAALAQIQKPRPRAAAIVYSGPGFGGHLKLELLALASGAPSLLRLLPDRESRIGRARLALSVLAKSIQTLGCLTLALVITSAAALCLRTAQRPAGDRHAHRP